MNALEKLEKSAISLEVKERFIQFYTAYKEALEKASMDSAPYEPVMCSFVEKLKEQEISPYDFAFYHQKVREPFDFYAFGVEFMRPLIDMSSSLVQGKNHLEEITAKLQRGENVIFLANHQIEADPQVLSILLEKEFPLVGEETIFVAGERVVIDPLAAPFSMGRNLLCIYSKRYIDHPPELKIEKQMHNKKTMELMSRLLQEGGHSIYVAPSGGRDRKNSTGEIEVAPFDPNSIEMFYLMAKKSGTPTTFYPMALSSYHLLPPPEKVEKEIGEKRVVGRGPAHLFIGDAIEMEPIQEEQFDKKAKRQMRADAIWSVVNKAYHAFPNP